MDQHSQRLQKLNIGQVDWEDVQWEIEPVQVNQWLHDWEYH